MAEVLAVSGETWGISGLVFLGFYAVMIVVGGLVAVAVFRALLPAGREVDDEPDPYVVAYAAHGPRVAFQAALASLKYVGAIVPRRRRLVRTKKTVSDAHALESAILSTMGKRHWASTDLQRHRTVQAALAGVRIAGRRLGVLLSEKGAVRRMVAALAAPVLVVVVGLFRLVTEWDAGRVDVWLIAEVVAAAVVAFVLFRVLRRQRTTRAGARLVQDLRKRHQHLNAASSPSFHTYGPGAAALSVGLFGIAAVHAVDPTLAAALRPSTGYGYGGSSGSSSSGSNCGGGSNSGYTRACGSSGSGGCSSGGGCGGGGGGGG